MKQLTILFSAILLGLSVNAQPVFTKADTLRGSLNENRDWFDVKKYTLNINPNLEAHSLDPSSVTWDCQVLKPYQIIQIDLQQPLIIDEINFRLVSKNTNLFKYIEDCQKN